MKRLIEPEAGLAVCRPKKTDALQLESFADQSIQIRARDDDVTAQSSRRFARLRKGNGQAFKNFLGKKGDLAFVVFPIVEKAIAPNPMAGHTLDRVDFLQGVIIRQAAGVSEVIMAGRDEYLANDHGERIAADASPAQFHWRPLRVKPLKESAPITSMFRRAFAGWEDPA